MHIARTLVALAAAVAGVFFWLACAVCLVALGRRRRVATLSVASAPSVGAVYVRPHWRRAPARW